MLSATLSNGLKAYGIGERLRALRLKKKMGLVELARHSSCRRRCSPRSSADLGFFFTAPRKKPVMAVARKKGRVQLPEIPGGRDSVYEFECLDYGATERRMNAYVARFLAGRVGWAHAHEGCEFIYVLAGTLEVTAAGEAQVLHGGASMHFDSSRPHAYRRIGSQACHAIVVTAA